MNDAQDGTMNPKQFNFWQDHSDNYLKMAFSTIHQGTLDAPDGYGRRTGDCGDTVTFFLTVRQDVIESITYQADGCMNTHACANTIIHLAENLPIIQAWNITPERVVDFLETLPESEIHCAELATGAFYQALSDFEKKGRDRQQSV